jgi:hypothetical protein
VRTRDGQVLCGSLAPEGTIWIQVPGTIANMKVGPTIRCVQKQGHEGPCRTGPWSWPNPGTVELAKLGEELKAWDDDG